MAKNIYRVAELGADGAEVTEGRFIEAKSKAAVLSHVAGPYFSIRVCTKPELVEALRLGAQVEDADQPDEDAKESGAIEATPVSMDGVPLAA